MKDNFSSASIDYARYRPSYPLELFNWISGIVVNKHVAWDCGTGNGQIAIELAKYFETIEATDISEQQLKVALQNDHIHYSNQPAEKTNFADNLFDLIIVGQAIHWFDFDAFYQEADRTLKHDGIFVVTGYGRLKINDEIDSIIDELYFKKIRKYWDPERKYIDENYATIPFPFNEIPVPQLENNFTWNFDHLIGYLNTWSAVKHFIKQESYNPIDEFIPQLQKFWGDQDRKVSFPLLLRAGKKGHS